ncbi:MAG TPA: heme biosynthesis HemY N-terminal domain-containing protein [Gammaproteobacteria bacterium]|nr:heme biosynthesis HemY N-terminal domain-containing protein [Gammaproteobacteria bacterium]
MKRAVAIVIVLAIATLIGVALNADNGYVLFRYGHTAAEMSLVTLVFFAIVAFVILYILVRLVVRLTRAPRKLGDKRREQRQRRAGRDFINGLIDVSEGRWEKGEREVVKAAEASDTALVNYLAAARAAQLQGAHERRDEYLHKAYELNDVSRMAVLLTQAELQIAHRQFELALATLRRIQELKPHHAHALRLLALLYKELGDYEQLHGLVPSLRNYKAMPADKIDAAELDAATALMAQAAERHDPGRLEVLWRGLSKPLRARPVAARTYAQALIDAEAGDAAEAFLRGRLKAGWDEDLARLYGLARSGDPAAQLARAESWLKQHDDSSALLLTLGRLAMVCELWGKARTYLENSAHFGKRAETFTELGRLLESLNEQPAAAEAYKSALKLTMEEPLSRASLPEGEAISLKAATVLNQASS